MLPEGQLLQTVFHDAYLLQNHEQVLYWLRRLCKEARLLTVHGAEGDELRVTSIVGIDEKACLVLIDRFQGQGKEPDSFEFLRLIGRGGGVYIGLQGHVVGMEEHSSGEVYRFDFGACIWVLQRRAHFRSRVPPSSNACCEIILPDGETIEFRVNDVSQGGVGGMLLIEESDSDSAQLETGSPVLEGELKLPGEPEIRFSGRVAHLHQVVRGGRRWWVLGLRFDDLDAEFERLIARYVRSREREQRRRDRGF